MNEMLIVVILQNILLFTNFCIFAKPKDYRFNFSQVALIVVMLLLSAASFFLVKKYMILFSMASCMIASILFFKNSCVKSINSLTISMVAYLLIDYLVVFVLSLFEKRYEFYTNDILYMFILIIPILGTNSYLNKKIKNLEDPILAVVTTIITIIVYSINIYSMKIELNSRSLLIISFIFILLISIAFILLSLYYRRQHQLHLNQYYNALEMSFEENRTFRHDYNNLMSTLGSLLEREDLSGLKDYYHELFDYSNDYIFGKSRNIEILTRISNGAVRGFLFSKIREAEKKEVKIVVNVYGEVKKIAMGNIELIRVLGIIIDNAIEEVEEQKKGK